MQQEKIFVEGEADAWYRRNPSTREPAGPEHPILKALQEVGIPDRGSFLDVGGAAGSLAAGFKRLYPHWRCLVIEPSRAAVEDGRKLFPDVEFICGSVSDSTLVPSCEMDVVAVCSVLH